MSSTLVIFPGTFLLDETAREWAFSRSSVGNLKAIPMIGGRYARIVGISREDAEAMAEAMGISGVYGDRLEGEDQSDFVARMEPIITQAFMDMKAGLLVAIWLNERDLALITQHPAYLAAAEEVKV